MADFLNALISRIFEVCSSCLLHQTIVMWLSRFSHFFGRLVLILSQSDHFTKAVAFPYFIGFVRLLIFKIVSFLDYLVFFSRGFYSYSFCIIYSLSKMAHFQDRLISQIFGVFSIISFCIHVLQPLRALALKCPMK